MSVEAIIQKIKQDADETATEIRENAAKEKEAIEKTTQHITRDLQAAADSKLQKAKAKLEAVTLSAAKQDVNLQLQTTKRELLNSVIDEAMAQLYAAPSDKYQAILCAAAKKELSDPASITSVEAPENRQVDTEAVLKELHCTAPVTYVSDMSAGMRLVGTNFVIDLTFSSLFSTRIDEIAISAADQLFADA